MSTVPAFSTVSFRKKLMCFGAVSLLSVSVFPASVKANDAVSLMMQAAGMLTQSEGDPAADGMAALLEKGIEGLSNLQGGAQSAHFAIKDYVDAQTEDKTGVPHNRTVSALFGQPLYNLEEQQIGFLEDILVNKDSGDIERIVFVPQKSGPAYWIASQQVDLFRPNSNDISVSENNAVKARLDPKESGAEIYNAQNASPYVSMKQLNKGRVYDVDQKPVGNIDAVVHRQGDARELVFTLQPVINGQVHELPFYMPFERAEFVKNDADEATDIYLNEDQTRAVAEMFFQTAENSGLSTVR
jgi:sporulation protein YlmC with PRC-barrel domain